MDRHDRPVGDRLALSPTDLLEAQRTLAAVGISRDRAGGLAALPGTCDETLALRLARFLRVVAWLAQPIRLTPIAVRWPIKE